MTRPPLLDRGGPTPTARRLTRRGSARRWLGTVGIAGVLAAGRLDALTVSELLDDPKMTPKRFANLFEGFEFELHVFNVQDPEVFLATRSGSCIDYAALADLVLKRRGYGTRLIRVEMVGKNMGHAVCYVGENRAYLDYNNRKYFFNLESSGRTIREIATKVADSFEANWTFAQEFTFDYKTGLKRMRFTVVKTDPGGTDPDLAKTRSATPDSVTNPARP